MKRIVRYIAAILMVVVYIAILIFGNIFIWKISKYRYIDPLKYSINFTLGMIVFFFSGYIWLIILVLPDRE